MIGTPFTEWLCINISSPDEYLEIDLVIIDVNSFVKRNFDNKRREAEGV